MRGCLLLLFAVVAVHTYSGGNPTWYESDEVDVYYSPDPIDESKPITFAELNKYQTFLGLQNLRTNDQVTVSRQSNQTIMRTIYPDVVNNDTLVWWDHAEIAIRQQNFLGESASPMIKVFKITGSILKRYLCWLPIYEEQYPYYQVFSLDAANTNTSKTYLPSINADDFIWASMNTLYNLGGTVLENSALANQRKRFKLYGFPPTVVDFNLNKGSIIEFYDEVWPEPDQLVLNLYHNFRHKPFYYYYQGQYYRTVLFDPIASFDSEEIPFADSGEKKEVPQIEGCIITEISSISLGSVLLILAAVGLSLYCVIGIIVNSIKKHTGLHRIPNWDFWKNLPFLVRDGFYFLVNLVTCKKTAIVPERHTYEAL